MQEIEFLIIGAGVTGLSFANSIVDRDYLILERDSIPGGYCKTIYQDEFVWDYGGHFFHFSENTLKREFHNSFKRNDLISHTKNTKIIYKNILIDSPFQMNIHQLPRNDFIDCLYDLFHRKDKDEYSNFLEMLYCKFGTSIVSMFLKPYNEKLYACDLNSLDCDAMGRFFPYADIQMIVNNMKRKSIQTYNDTFHYHRRGAFAFIEVLLSKLNPQKILTDTPVIAVDYANHVVVTKHGSIRYRYLVNTAPFDWFVSQIDICNNKVAISRCLTSNKVLVLNLGFDSAPFNKTIHWMYIPGKDYRCYRVGFYNNILNQEKASLYVEVGYSREDTINVDEAFDHILMDLKKLGIIKKQRLISHSTIIMDPAYVHITKESIKAVADTKRYLEPHGVFTVGRYGEWRYCSIEDCMLSARELAHKLWGLA